MTKDKVPYSRKPSDLSLEEWQVRLRKQYAVDQHFKIKNIGNHPFFSDFEVHNPESGKTYKVSIRDNIKSFHFCTCPDFTINGLGTCKHIEYLLLHFEKEGKDEVMLEGFMDSVRALTEIDTESYVKNSFQQQPVIVNEKESVRRENDETSENPETSAAADSIKTASTYVKTFYPSGSLMSRLGGFLKKLAAKILKWE